ncbi:DNA polymerase I [Desulfoluna butyratoxydans]|uniref:DNA polymerase I n=1 Tax=Desulfoluna butyratoxydans TaxID=231438 RepID=A0A4U8YLR6_9BACT|nr:DNA polymerase I [Desulfoluna butyratoxydans]VFQ44671.1 dna polymerase 1 [Desulfoluna butyratoxydans]
MTDKKKIYLIDGSAYIYRSFHALPPLTNAEGLPTNAVLGFTNIIVKMMNDFAPTHAVICFDAKGPTFRHEMYEEYKANRPPMPDDLRAQIPFVHKVAEAYRIPTMEQQGLEADDVIGTLAKKAEAAGFEVVIVTGDKDFMQLVTDTCVISDPARDVYLDRDAVKEKLGVWPEQVTDIMALTGDTSDNVPGVPGIGKKTAPALINEFGSLDGLYEQVETITKKKQKENLITNKDLAFISRDLVTIKTDADLPFDEEALVVPEPDGETLLELFKELGFKKYIKMFSAPQKKVTKAYHAVLTEEALAELADKIKDAPLVAVDTETTALSPMLAEVVGISVAVTPHEAYYIPFGHTGLESDKQLSKEAAFAVMKPILEDPSIRKCGQNIKYDLLVLKGAGIELRGIAFDTMVASYLLNPTRRSHGLDDLAMELFDHQTIKFEEVAGKGKNQLLFSEVPLSQAVPYAAEDADITLMLAQEFEKELEAKNLTELFDTMEMPLMHVLAEMEHTGVAVNEEALVTISKTFETEMETIEASIYRLAGEEFNINSSQQLGTILFEKLELPVQKKTKKKTGYSTDVEVLTALAAMHDLPAQVIRYRTLAKLKSTYADALVGLIHPTTHRIHTSYNQTVAVTGRLSSSNPNLQNIPVRSDEGRMIRGAFVPAEGKKLIAADYSQIELRLLAHCSGDPILIESFNSGEDIHKRTAAEMFDCDLLFVTGEMRRQAKAVNFGIMYGMSPYGLSKELAITQKMAKSFIENYFARYSGVKAFIDTCIEEARETKTTSTLLGRIRPLPEISSANRNVKQFAERSAVNTPIQGTAADLIKLAMLRCSEIIKEKELKTRMIMSVHDEIVFEAPEAEVNEVKGLMQQAMENVWELAVPLSVNIEVGDNWNEAH